MNELTDLEISKPKDRDLAIDVATIMIALILVPALERIRNHEDINEEDEKTLNDAIFILKMRKGRNKDKIKILEKMQKKDFFNGKNRRRNLIDKRYVRDFFADFIGLIE